VNHNGQPASGLDSGQECGLVGGELEAAYIVGKTSDGRWAGLKTTVVET
jgi:hypothetical protein